MLPAVSDRSEQLAAESLIELARPGSGGGAALTQDRQSLKRSSPTPTLPLPGQTVQRQFRTNPDYVACSRDFVA